MSRNFLILLAGALLGLSLAIGSSVLAERSQPTLEPLPLEELRVFSEVFEKIKTDYVEQVSDKELLESAIGGMLGGLDPHSAYLDEEAFRDLQVGTSGEFGGLGIEVSMEDGFVKVVAPIDDTPAQRAGVEAGDLIIRLDDRSVKGLSLGEAVKIMRGEPGTTIRLTVVREGEDRPLEISITRDIIQVKSVKSRILEPGYGYIRVSQFQNRTAENLSEAVDALKKESEDELKGVVLDLRNNPGGVLNGAVAVSDAFIDKGLIVYTEGRTTDSANRFKATPGDLLTGAPMVVLINGGSASASEIVAGAMQDHQRAVVMGTKSFGKGSVQTILPMNNGAAVKLTTARYFTPNGRSIQAEGITPDIILESLKFESVQREPDKHLKESHLSRHLENGDAKPSEQKPKGAKEGAPDEALSLAKSDYQLYEALNLLKGMNILHARMQR